MVVQPAVDRFLTDERGREALLLELARGNRWRVATLIGLAMLTAVVAMLAAPRLRVGYAVALTFYLLASGIFVNVSWRHWPARVFALPSELAGFQRRLRLQAWAILALVGLAFVIALTVSVGAS
jgi:hypothetical protein